MLIKTRIILNVFSIYIGLIGIVLFLYLGYPGWALANAIPLVFNGVLLYVNITMQKENK